MCIKTHCDFKFGERCHVHNGNGFPAGPILGMDQIKPVGLPKRASLCLLCKFIWEGNRWGGGGGITNRLCQVILFIITMIKVLTCSLRRPFKPTIFFQPPIGGRLNMHSVFWEFGREPCQHATRGCDICGMTCIHASVSRSPREHASVPPDKRHCRQRMSSLFCGFLPNPFIHDLFRWRSSHRFVKTDLYPLSLMSLRNAVCSWMFFLL